MNDLELIEQRVKKEVEMKEYGGSDRVVLAEEKKAELIELRENRPAFHASTGLPTLDLCLDGFRKGQLVIVSGPPKNGKTLLCQTFTKRFTEQSHRCMWFSYELGYEELFDKFPMKSLDFYVPNYLQSGNVEWIEDRIIEAKQKYGTSVVFIDHLDFLRDPEVLKGVSLNLSSYVGSIVQKIKRMAVVHEVLIVLMSHIRKNNWASNKIPTSEELRDSGQIAQLADIVMMVVRKRNEDSSVDEIYLESDALIGVIENRHNGKTKVVHAQIHEGEFYESTDQKLNEPKQIGW